MRFRLSTVALLFLIVCISLSWYVHVNQLRRNAGERYRGGVYWHAASQNLSNYRLWQDVRQWEHYNLDDYERDLGFEIVNSLNELYQFRKEIELKNHWNVLERARKILHVIECNSTSDFLNFVDNLYRDIEMDERPYYANPNLSEYRELEEFVDEVFREPNNGKDKTEKTKRKRQRTGQQRQRTGIKARNR